MCQTIQKAESLSRMTSNAGGHSDESRRPSMSWIRWSLVNCVYCGSQVANVTPPHVRWQYSNPACDGCHTSASQPLGSRLKTYLYLINQPTLPCLPGKVDHSHRCKLIWRLSTLSSWSSGKRPSHQHRTRRSHCPTNNTAMASTSYRALSGRRIGISFSLNYLRC